MLVAGSCRFCNLTGLYISVTLQKKIMKNENYIQEISGFSPLSAAFKTYLNGILSEYTFEAHRSIPLQDLAPISGAMVQSGALRMVHQNEHNGNEKTLYIYLKDSFLPHPKVCESFELPLSLYFLKDTIIQGINPEFLPTIFKVFPEFINIQEKIYAQIIAHLIRHLIAISGTKSEERYEYLETRHRAIQTSIIQKYIASFIGIDIKTYSRLRSARPKKRQLP